MGVHGLWKLIESAGKPVPVETLENKVLAVDVSIWLHQLMKGYQTPSGASVSNAYLLGLFSRVCKLLFTNVKPVFVFDGGVPQLKKKTIAARQQQKSKSVEASEKLREQLLKNLLKQKAVGQVLEEIRGQSSPKKKPPDMFELPPLPQVEESDVEEISCSSSEEDVKPVKMKYKDLHTIDVKSEEFKTLPADIRHDILTELKETRKQNSWGRVHEMPEESGDFSKYQMSRLLKRRSVQVSLEEAEKEMGGRTLSLGDVEALLADGGIEINPQLGKRIAADNTTRYIYVSGTGESRSQIQENLAQADKSKKSSANIETEIIDCDELDESDLIERLEIIEKAYNELIVKKEKNDPLDVLEDETISPSVSNVDVKNIKEEPVDSDGQSDTEVIRGVGSINDSRKEWDDENQEFGTDTMFDNESSSEGVIIDGMDLVNDNSGLSQEQILALIKNENINEAKLFESVDESIPSTSKENHSQSVSEEPNSNVAEELNNLIRQKVTKDKIISKVSDDSKILDSLFFKMMPRMKFSDPDDQTVPTKPSPEKKVDHKSNSPIKPNNTVPSNTTTKSDSVPTERIVNKSFTDMSNLKATVLAREAAKSNPPSLKVVDFDKLADSLAFSSSDSESEANTPLPCEVAEIVMPTSKSDEDKRTITMNFSVSSNSSRRISKIPQSSSSGFVNDNLKVPAKKSDSKNISETKDFKSSSNIKVLPPPDNPSKLKLSSKTNAPTFKKDISKTKVGGSMPKKSSSDVMDSSRNKKNDDTREIKSKSSATSKTEYSSLDETENSLKLSPPSKETNSKKTIPETDKVLDSTSSDSDCDFVEVPLTNNPNLIPEFSKVDCGLQIEIEPTKGQIEDDIFADIFSDKGISSSSVNINKNKWDEAETLNGNTNAATLKVDKHIKKDQSNLHTETLSAYQSKSGEKNLNSSTKPKKEQSSLSSDNIRSLSDESEIFLSNKKQDSSQENISQIYLIDAKPDDIVNAEDDSSNIISTSSFDKVSSDVEPELPSNTEQNVEQDSDNSEDIDNPSPMEEPSASTSEVKPKRKLNMKQLEKLQEILENKEREMVIDQNREDRMASSMSDQMYQEAQELLRLFGVPYIVAPMEAEAQCAFMDLAGLTQGTITDDSDIWLFGGNKVYKNFFDQKKFVLEFQANDIQNYFKLNRSLLVLLALLVGSDYTVGLQGVGPVTAMEILATFPPAKSDTTDCNQLVASLQRFRDWWQARPTTHARLAKKLRNIELHQGFPSLAVVNAYFQPLVDDSREPFSWGEPDLPGLRDYAERKFGWNRNRTDQILLPVINKLNKKSSQTTLHTFFGAIPNISGHREQMSKRVQTAVSQLEGGGENFEPVEPRPRQPRARGRGRASSTAETGGSGVRGRGRGRGRGIPDGDEQFVHGNGATPLEIIPQREKDKEAALKRKQQAIDLFKNKKKKVLRKRKNVRQEKEEANLSESSSDEN